MRVGIIAASNIMYSPYVFMYTNLMEKENISFDVIYPNKKDIKEHYSFHTYSCEWNGNCNVVFNYFHYANTVKKICKKNQYDFLVVLTQNMAVFLSFWLVEKYRGKYLVDIRDYTHENFNIFYWLEKNAINNACINVISSEKFKEFLPKSKYLMSHNLSMSYTNFKKLKWKKASSSIVVGYVGSIGYIDNCKRFMDLISADSRFCFYFYGASGSEKVLKEYASTLKCDRIKFFGRYLPEEKINIIDGVDILFNVYGNDSQLVRCALSNKLYDALYLKKPLLVSPNTYMAEMAGELGFSLDLDSLSNLDCLFDWYNELIDFSNSADEKLEYIINQNNETNKTIINVIKKVGNI